MTHRAQPILRLLEQGIDDQEPDRAGGCGIWRESSGSRGAFQRRGRRRVGRDCAAGWSEGVAVSARITKQQMELQNVTANRRSTEEGLVGRQRAVAELRQQIDQLRAVYSRVRTKRKVAREHRYASQLHDGIDEEAGTRRAGEQGAQDSSNRRAYWRISSKWIPACGNGRRKSFCT